MRRVVCAAIRAADGEVLMGLRHYDWLMHRQIEQRGDGSKFMHRLDEDQGFVDQHGVFMDRFEAFRVARAAKQPIDLDQCGTGLLPDGAAHHKLYSEALY